MSTRIAALTERHIKALEIEIEQLKRHLDIVQRENACVKADRDKLYRNLCTLACKHCTRIPPEHGTVNGRTCPGRKRS